MALDQSGKTASLYRMVIGGDGSDVEPSPLPKSLFHMALMMV